ncbi:cyclic nucleotide-binding domain-containing protein [Leptolyngbya iicbica]|uniref:Cyclic nucleotide-binding protein n=2 Tax=Cyanophyceae TaxID=3028117 RepID=A0A4Q7E194_9CYAN|nr:cyclic nucleotide-binding domain-containing protein [Leptolyngbya sp. LK]RZM74715.1 cyclic nucleotide-binding protein [Leptolyngbya sp. LK]
MERILFILGILEDEDVDWLVTAGTRRELADGEVLIREGELIDAIYLILTGQFLVSLDHSPKAYIARLSSGEVMGEMSFVDHLPPSATVTASEPSVVLMVERSVLNRKLDQDIGFAKRWYQSLATLLSIRLRGTVKHLEAEFWEPTELNQALLSSDMADNMKLGGIRFDWLMRRLRDTEPGI